MAGLEFVVNGQAESPTSAWSIRMQKNRHGDVVEGRGTTVQASPET